MQKYSIRTNIFFYKMDKIPILRSDNNEKNINSINSQFTLYINYR